eukprot:TRINITY_DN4628_c0_g2_i1.p1 TRINITY_DN4628_c0_g2~~TRINITY_DN4628_c0_g2_i1.p1  ORF type:complete len:394 (-),score=29.48 TRINITY_DN4628_c0_g2_i1:71-1252(-)
MGDWVGCIVCFCIGLITFSYIGFINHSELPKKIERSQLWAEPSAGARWVEGKCIIHEAGISDRGGCWRQGADSTVFAKGVPFSECPGLHWCADEGGMCDCDGDVLYSGAILHQNLPVEKMAEKKLKEMLPRAKMPEPGNGNTVHSKAGTPVKCAHGEGEAFHQDPWPGRQKACFCTPRKLVTLLQHKGPIHPLDKYCPAVANSAFQREAGQSITSRRLQGQLSNLTELWEYPEGHCRGRGRGGNIFLSDAYLDKDYQVRLNWALVEVQDTSATGGNASKLRCAYTYGAPDVSREDNQDTYMAIYKKWKSYNGSSAPCYIRKGGVCGDSSCAVALNNPLDLPKDHPSFGLVKPVLFMFLGTLPFQLGLGIACYFCFKRLRRTGYSVPSCGFESD